MWHSNVSNCSETCYIPQNALAYPCRKGWATGKILRNLKGGYLAQRHCYWSADWHEAAAKSRIFLSSPGYPFASLSPGPGCVFHFDKEPNFCRLSSIPRLDTGLRFNPVKLQLDLKLQYQIRTALQKVSC